MEQTKLPNGLMVYDLDKDIKKYLHPDIWKALNKHKTLTLIDSIDLPSGSRQVLNATYIAIQGNGEMNEEALKNLSKAISMVHDEYTIRGHLAICKGIDLTQAGPEKKFMMVCYPLLYEKDFYRYEDDCKTKIAESKRKIDQEVHDHDRPIKAVETLQSLEEVETI